MTERTMRARDSINKIIAELPWNGDVNIGVKAVDEIINVVDSLLAEKEREIGELKNKLDYEMSFKKTYINWSKKEILKLRRRLGLDESFGVTGPDDIKPDGPST